MKIQITLRRLFTGLCLFMASWLYCQEGEIKSLDVGVLADFPPQYSLNDSGEPEGFAVEIMDTLAAGNGITFNYKVYEDWARLHKALEAGEIDLIPNMGVTERRSDKFSFSRSVETFPVSIFTRKNRPYSSWKLLKANPLQWSP